jgi:beta-lactamase regulating signal transducer with metallopeptidase domain
MPDSVAGNPTLALPGWLFVHLLWQGLLVWIVCLIWLRAWQDRPPNKRYAVALGALLVLAAAPLITLAWYRFASQQIPETSIHDPGRVAAIQSRGDLHSARPLLRSPYIAPSPFRSSIANVVAPATPWLAFAWLLGLVGAGIWQLAVYGIAQRSVAVSFNSRTDLEPVVKRLAGKMGVSRTVRIGDSSLVNSPATLGSIRPVILLPHEMIGGLRKDQVELLLLHELAHIRRNDYFTNLLQVAIEAIYFWHPVVWYLNRRVRIEREHCCDEMAVTCSGEPLEYARTLTIFEKLRMQIPALGQALAGASLKDRIARLLQRRAEKLGPRGAAIPVLSIMLTLGVTMLAVPLLGSVVSDLKTLHELNHSSFTQQIYRVLGATGASDNLARNALQDIVAAASTDAEPTPEQLHQFAIAWEQHSTPESLSPLIIAGATATDTGKWRENAFAFGSERTIGRICNWLWLAAQRDEASRPDHSHICARAALMLASQEPFSVGVHARRLLIEPSFVKLAKLDPAQQQRLWRTLGHVNGVSESVNPEIVRIGLILDREDVDGKQLDASDARELAQCISHTLRYTGHRPDISASMASITRRLKARFASRPELAEPIASAAKSADADPLFKQWVQPLAPGEADPNNYIAIQPDERRRMQEMQILPLAPGR